MAHPTQKKWARHLPGRVGVRKWQLSYGADVLWMQLESDNVQKRCIALTSPSC